MTLTDRRGFLRRAGLSAAGLAALGGPLQGLLARDALATGSTGVAPNNGGYGPIGPVPDLADGAVRLHPRGLPIPQLHRDRNARRFPPGTTNDEAIVFVGDQGRAKGAAIFSRLEASFHDSGRIYLVSTQGGDAPAGEDPPSGFGDGFGELWVFDTTQEMLTLLFESPSRTVLELPDNIAISPQKWSPLCEDGPVENFLRASPRRARSSTSRSTRSLGARGTSSPARPSAPTSSTASAGLADLLHDHGCARRGSYPRRKTR